MGSTLLDICMRIFANGPALTEKDKINDLAGRALALYQVAVKTCPQRSSANVGRRVRKAVLGDALEQLRGDN